MKAVVDRSGLRPTPPLLDGSAKGSARTLDRIVDDRGDATERCRARAQREVRRAPRAVHAWLRRQVRMRVDSAGDHQQSGCVDFVARCADLSDGNDAPVVDPDIGNCSRV